MLKERRRHVRHTINRVAKIQSAAGSLPRDCLVTDISESGARLYAEGIVVPDSFVLVVTGTETIRRDCRVVRQRDRRRVRVGFGIPFVIAGLDRLDPAIHSTSLQAETSHGCAGRARA
jgi:hypothetical protein